MSRPLRVLYPNAWYHVINRGAGRNKIYKNNLHRNLFLELLDESHQMFNIQIHAYCLMDNHYHLLLSTPDANLPRVMRHINGIYTQRYNRVSKTDGPLFKGRYKAQLIEDDCYQLIVSRYIHLNPVKANMVAVAVDYKWSSYRAYLGLVKKPRWLTTQLILDQISTRASLSHVNDYNDYVEHKSLEEINTFSSTKYTAPVIGSKKFRADIVHAIDSSTAEACAPDIKRTTPTPNIDLIINYVCIFYNVKRESLLSSKRGQSNWPRMVCIYICRKYFGFTLRSIANVFQSIGRTTISTTAFKCEKILQQHQQYSEIDSIYHLIMQQNLQGDT